MKPINERLNTPISDAELERRWSASRRAMEEHGVDVLVMQANNDFMGGYPKWFTDMPGSNGYPYTVIFPRDDRMTVIGQGPFGMDARIAENDAVRRGVARQMGTPAYASANYTSHYDAELAETALDRFAGATIGLLGLGSMSYAFVDRLKRGQLRGATFVDAAALIDPIKAIKSDEEIALMRRTAAMQDAAMQAVATALRPGLRDSDVVAIAREESSRLGSEQGWFMAASGPVGTAAVMQPPHLQNRVIRDGDQFCLLVENNGPGGYYTEIGRTFVLGRASQEMKDEFAFVLEAQQFTLNLLRPGAASAEVARQYNDFMVAHGRPREQRLYCHGQGYDMVERPLLRHDETMPLAANMVLSAHPTYVTKTTYSWVCDNFLLRSDGTTESLHRFAQKIHEL